MIDPAYNAEKQQPCTDSPLKIYPLGNEEDNDLIYPSITFHYSVNNDGRYVYVVGEDRGFTRSQLFVWDLNRGSSRCYRILNMEESSQVKHMYEIESHWGILVSKNITYFHAHAVRLDHQLGTVKIERTLFCQLVGVGNFWSSARSRDGIIFVSQHGQNTTLHVTEIGLDATVRTVVLSSPMPGLRFCGQPWMSGDYVYLFETATLGGGTGADAKYLTGKLIRANLCTRKLCTIWTRFGNKSDYKGIVGAEDDDVDDTGENRKLLLFAPNKLARRVKHVERDGWLWIILEVVELGLPFIYGGGTGSCQLYTMDMASLRWRKLNWQPNCSFDELTLDVTGHGTAVLLRKEIREQQNIARITAFMLVSRQPRSLLDYTFQTLITHFPHLRSFSPQQLTQIGIPTNLLI